MSYKFLWNKGGETFDISVVTIAYNSAATIHDTIDSVRKLKAHLDLQYIVIDGGSTDGTIDILKANADVIDAAVCEPDEGISDAFNKGIDIARGGLVGIINSDDYYDCDGVCAIVDAWKKKGQGVYHGKIVFLAGEFDNGYIAEGSHDGGTMDVLMHHPTVFVDRRIYSKYGAFQKSLKSAMDYELLLRFRNRDVPFYYVPRVISYYSTTGMSNKHAVANLYESHVIRVSMGYSWSKSYLLYWYRVVKMRARRVLYGFGMGSVIGFYRAKISKIKRSRIE